jgi:hypothetical protein
MSMAYTRLANSRQCSREQATTAAEVNNDESRLQAHLCDNFRRIRPQRQPSVGARHRGSGEKTENRAGRTLDFQAGPLARRVEYPAGTVGTSAGRATPDREIVAYCGGAWCVLSILERTLRASRIGASASPMDACPPHRTTRPDIHGITRIPNCSACSRTAPPLCWRATKQTCPPTKTFLATPIFGPRCPYSPEKVGQFIADLILGLFELGIDPEDLLPPMKPA